MTPSEFLDKWSDSAAAERSNAQSFLNDLCAVLNVDPPHAATSDPERDAYVFEKPVTVPHGGRQEGIGFIDLFKRGHFVLEAKQGSEKGSSRLGTARRDSPAWHIAMQDAFGQALTYARAMNAPPPFLIVTDVGHCFDLYASFDHTASYRAFPDAVNSRIYLRHIFRQAHDAEPDPIEYLPEERHLTEFGRRLRRVFTDPYELDPSKHAANITREVAGRIATIARQLEGAGHNPELVAKFLMRCLFTMFAEDVGLLPRRIFSDAFEDWRENPEHFKAAIEELWQKMNEGGVLWGKGKVWRFNGGLFSDPTAIDLNRFQLHALREAAESNWAHVDPSIFGTLLERALDPKERHRLGAHYTPRAYVERLVRPTIEEPLRKEWETVRASVRTLIADEASGAKNEKEALRLLETFLDRLAHVRILDPACGTGNFLYVSLDVLKRIENEVLDMFSNLGGGRITSFGRLVSPKQFLGIEIKRWAKEIAELVLWIGYLQWQLRTRGFASNPEEPILHDYHNIECRDAVLAYDEKVPLLDDDGNPVTRWDGETMKRHPVTGEDVPDDTARVPVYRYVNPRKTEWPEAEFIVGNPPFIGNKKMRVALDDAYVDALRSTHKDVPDTADFVMYWWDEAARLVTIGAIRRFGLITTNSITQPGTRRLLQNRMGNSGGLRLTFAIPDHPWSDSETGAAVRIAMTVGASDQSQGTLLNVTREREGSGDERSVDFKSTAGTINADLTVGANVSDAVTLRSNKSLSFMGMTLVGEGFRINSDQLSDMGLKGDELPEFVHPYLIGRELTRINSGRFVIDLYGLDIEDVRERHPAIYQWLNDRVRPNREQNKREGYRSKWWLFGETRGGLRKALKGLTRYIATPETSKHRIFVFLELNVVPDHTVFAIALDDGFSMGVLSSRAHSVWSAAAGSRMGVGNDLRWRNVTCFEPFAFPAAAEGASREIAQWGEALDRHRKRQQLVNQDLALTDMYNVLEKLRSGGALTDKEKVIHEHGLVSVLKQIHDDLDAAVFDAYGWPHDLTDEQILERLVALNAERAEEERRGIVRWLRPEFQNPLGSKSAQQTTMAGVEIEEVEAEAQPKAAVPWPKDLPAQIAAVRDLITAGDHEAWTVDRTARAFKGAKRPQVQSVLDSLAALGLLVTFGEGKEREWRSAS
ncbi:MAG TPA: DNA methyltransferase [Thermoanaerobaculia bacterium]|nr:DNA methyltransferase [Thermoanaerobaculia bacterium]